MSLEIERKWKLSALPDGLPEGVSIRQGYVTTGQTEVRLRDKGGKRLLTVKRGKGLTREEVEITLTEAQFEAMWPLTVGARVEKTRSKVPHGALTIEVDVFTGDLAGLTVAEVEFPSEADATAFEAPGWFGDDLTGVKGWSNAELAQQGVP